MASVQRMVRCDLDVALAKGAKTEQEFSHALSYRTGTWSAEDQTGREELHILSWAKKRAPCGAPERGFLRRVLERLTD